MHTISQSFLPSSPVRNILVRQSNRRQAGDTARLLEACKQDYIGVATKQSSDGIVEWVAFATPDEVFVISVEADYRSGLLPSDESFGRLLLGMAGRLIGFDMAKLALRLHRDLKLPVCGIDLSTLFSPTREPWLPSQFIKSKVSRLINKFEVDNLWNSADEQGSKNVCLRAWLSVCAAVAEVTPTLTNALGVDTRLVFDTELTCLGEYLRQTDLLGTSKPNETPSEFSQAKLTKGGHISLQNARYRNRVRRSRQTAVILTNENGREFTGRARGAVGKTTTIKINDQSFEGRVQNVRVVGRQEPTNSEKARDEFFLHVLQGKKTLRNSTFIRRLWFPSRRKHRSGNHTQIPVEPPYRNIPDLNPSQNEAVSMMVSEEPLVIVHGPPGTGKTTTISEAASIWLGNRSATWIIAHSNVAVKNIAEKLYKRDVNFRILVSLEFHLEWHEHIYEMIKDKVIRSDELPDDPGALKRSLGGTCIMLSTLSMLSNPTLGNKGVFEAVPVVQLVIDEASQINLFDFMHVFEKCRDLRKVCFFGDPQQLPPYGKDNVPGLQTIFDLEHLREKTKFLNVQYRMPVPLGKFISLHVYDGNLNSQHKLHDMSCLSFVDASNGEEEKAGFSWKNAQEIQTIVHLVRSYYKHTDFCVITPYDAQRAAIEGQLKSENLPWERVFNVDSFQGNEADYVLISVVRSSKPGFLTSLNRMNVMLTRCRAGLVVVTSSSFLRGGGERTLLGKLAQHWEGIRGSDKTWVDWRLVVEGVVDLPGAPGPKRNSQRRAPTTWSFSQNVNGSTTAQYPFSGLPPTSPYDNRFLQGAPPFVPRPWHEVNPAFANVTNLSWAQIAASPRLALPRTLSPRTSYNSTSTAGGSMMPSAFESPSFPRLPHYGGHGEQQPSTYNSMFPSLGATPSTWYPPTVPQPPVRLRYIATKVSPKTMVPKMMTTIAPTIPTIPTPPTMPTPPTIPTSPTLSATVERISPTVIRIVSRKPVIDDTTKVQKVAEKCKGNMNRNSSSK